jgi:protease-4
VTANRATLIVILLLAAGGFATLFAALAMRSPKLDAGSASVLVLDVPSLLEESEAPDRPLVLGPGRRGRFTLYTLVDALTRAAADDGVGALVLHIDDIGWGWAKLDEVRDALTRFSAAGKPIYASLGAGGEAEYLLASTADVVSMPP